jgi:two-component system, NtrC family, nitrogen regulation response regulator GlnG
MSPGTWKAIDERRGSGDRFERWSRGVYNPQSMSADDRSLSTIDPRQRARRATAPAQLVLTIAYHPDVERIGERHYLGRGALELSRQRPAFSAAGDVRMRPLADRNVSRKPLRLTPDGDALAIDASDTTTPVRVDGAPLTGRAMVTPDRLDRGVVVQLAERIVLLVHRMGSLGVARVRHNLVGISEAIAALGDAIDRVAPADVATLIRGESGVGKELVARAIHQASVRHDGPFVAINMAAIPATTAAAELFGHERGAYTGAVGAREGLFAAADGGSLFLDEIGATSPEVQALLLRALESGEVRPVGGQRARRVDVRVLAATDENLEAAVHAGEFRLPLLHRLSAYELHVPPLRERRDDIVPLLLHFVRGELEQRGGADRLREPSPEDPPWLSVELIERLLAHPWPGNVRELRNVARRIVIDGAARDHVLIDGALDRLLARAASEIAPPSASADIEDDALIEALRANDWEVAGAARTLRLPKTTLYRLVEQCDRIRMAKDLERAEIEGALAESAGQLPAAARRLGVSRRGLRIRMTQLGMET